LDFNQITNDGVINLLVKTSPTQKILSEIASGFRMLNRTAHAANYGDSPMHIDRGASDFQSLAVRWSDVGTSQVTGINLSFRFLYPPIVQYG
jgi:hypothetical protein